MHPSKRECAENGCANARSALHHPPCEREHTCACLHMSRAVHQCKDTYSHPSTPTHVRTSHSACETVLRQCLMHLPFQALGPSPTARSTHFIPLGAVASCSAAMIECDDASQREFKPPARSPFSPGRLVGLCPGRGGVHVVLRLCAYYTCLLCAASAVVAYKDCGQHTWRCAVALHGGGGGAYKCRLVPW